MNDEKEFEIEVSKRISKQISNNQLKAHADAFLTEGLKSQYIYNFSWLGRPIIQTPQDLIALQEIIFKIKNKYLVVSKTIKEKKLFNLFNKFIFFYKNMNKIK
jgi:cephalosporin hydroxylase